MIFRISREAARIKTQKITLSKRCYAVLIDNFLKTEHFSRHTYQRIET